MLKQSAFGLLSLCALTVGEVALAEEEYTGFNRSLDDRFQLLAGAYWADVNSSYKTDRNNSPNSSKIDLEQLGLGKDETQLYLYGRVRFSERWRLDFSYFGTDRNAKETAEAEFDIGDPDGPIPVGVGVKTHFKTKVYAARVGYSFVRTERAELGAGLGVYVADLDLKIKSQFTVGDSPTVAVTVSDTTDVTAPLPTFGLYGAYAFTKNLMLEARGAYFTLNYDKYSGHMWDAMAALDYRPFEHVGFGIGYAYWSAHLGVDKSKKEEDYDVSFEGPLAYVRAGF